MRIVLITALWKREKLTKMFLDYYYDLAHQNKDKYELIVCASYSPVALGSDDFVSHLFFEKVIDVKMEKPAISNFQTKIYNWVKEKHSYRATGERLKQILL